MKKGNGNGSIWNILALIHQAKFQCGLGKELVAVGMQPMKNITKVSTGRGKHINDITQHLLRHFFYESYRENQVKKVL